MFRYRNINSGQIVESDVKRWDLEKLARWAAADGTEVVSKPVVADRSVDEPTDVTEAEVPATLDVEVPAEEAPVKAAPKRRTRAKKPVVAEAED